MHESKAACKASRRAVERGAACTEVRELGVVRVGELRGLGVALGLERHRVLAELGRFCGGRVIIFNF